MILRITSVLLNGRRTTIKLEPEMWDALDEVAELEKTSRQQLLRDINGKKAPKQPLTTAVRVFLVLYFKEKLERQEAATAKQPISKPPANHN